MKLPQLTGVPFWGTFVVMSGNNFSLTPTQVFVSFLMLKTISSYCCPPWCSNATFPTSLGLFSSFVDVSMFHSW